jgi:uncharacterized membrane-anchored protein YitT (DUF2179 family)
MNSILEKIIISLILKPRNNKIPKKEFYTRYELAFGLKELLKATRRLLKDFFLISIGVFSAAFGFKGFLLTNHFIDGGATGISLLLSAITHLPLSVLIIAVNLPFVILGYRIMGKEFAIKTAVAIMALAIVLAMVEFPNVTNDNLLVAIFGGFFLGAGIGLAVRGGAVIDGTEVLAIYLSKKFGTTLGDIIIIINIFIFGTAAYYLGVEKALYSMITYISASKTLDFLVEGIEEYIGVTIISTKSEDIRLMIINHLGRGVTVYNGQGGFGKSGERKQIDILYSVLTRLELNKLTSEIEKIDSKAFVVMNSVKDTKGGMLKKRPLKH